MTPLSLATCSRLIQATALLVLGLSAVLLLTPGLGKAVFYLVYFQKPEMPADVPALADAYIRFANGIIGAVMAGWMVAILVLARGPFLAGEPIGWKAIAWPLAAWFGVDTMFSLAHGVWGNVALNTSLLVAFGVPLLASRRFFSPGRES